MAHPVEDLAEARHVTRHAPNAKRLEDPMSLIWAASICFLPRSYH